MINLENIIKVVLVILLIFCLADMPYGYYQFVRFSAMVGFAILAYRSHERDDGEMTIVYAGLAILFQPLIKISLDRTLWNIVDVIVVIGLIGTIFLKPKEEQG